MGTTIKGQQLIEALADISGPARLPEIVNRVAENSPQQPLTSIMKKAKAVLDAGVRYGYIEKNKDHYYLPEDSSQPLDDQDVSEEEIAEANPRDCYGNQRGMRQRRMAEKRGRRSRSRSSRRSLRRRRRREM